ncbi:MAG: tandem-95 repeat protein [Candidatus Cloacimonetes bacterium]|jgi:hypothetical protein|nr:tandem-95 repeat protein [Candidatus Cloacimonadota bacterium]MBT7470054.1 tandem-95 repeat protein [Candidatus Cloacimonadota bacterium]
MKRNKLFLGLTLLMVLMATGLFATNYVVSGAGNYYMDGTYTYLGTNSVGAHVWSFWSQALAEYEYLYHNGSNTWFISGSYEIFDYYADYKCIPASFSSTVPPVTGWVGVNSVGPGPTVTAVNLAPTAHNVSGSGVENAIALAGLVATDTENNPLTYTISSQPSNGSATMRYGLNFNGTNSYTKTHNNVDLSGSAITIEYWFKGSYMQSVVRHQSEAGYIVAGYHGAHILSNDGLENGIAVGAGVTDGKWHHVAMTWEQNTTNGFKSYLDGNLVEQRNSSNTPLPNMNDEIYFGSWVGTSDFANGAIAEVRIWNYARTQSELQAHLSGSEAGLVGYWPLCSDNGGNSPDLTANDNYTLLYSTSWTLDVVHYHPSQNFVGTDSFTYTANDGTSDSNVATVSIAVNDVNYPPTASDVTATTSENVAVTIDFVGSDVDGNALTFIVVDAPSNGVCAGGVYTPDAGWYGIDSFTYVANDGALNSNVATVTVTVTEENVAPIAEDIAVTTEENIPVAISLVATDENSSDILSYTIQTPPAYGELTESNEAQSTTSLSFDGSGDYLKTNENLNFSQSAFTIEYWFKGTDINSAVRAQADNGFIVSGWEDMHILSNDGGTDGLAMGDGVEDGTWHHVAMTWQQNTTNGFKSYLDGELVDQRNSNDSWIPYINDELYFGSYIGESEFMNGSLDEMRIWIVARTQAELQANMNVSLTGNEAGLYLYYPVEEGSGSTTVDLAGTANATLYGNVAWVSAVDEVSGASVNFDGWGDYVGIPDADALDLTGGFTIELWMNATSWTDESYQGVLVSKDEWSNGGSGYGITCGNDGELSFIIGGSDGVWHDITTSGLQLDTWYHITAVHDGANLRLYVNGTEVANSAIAVGAVVNGEDLHIGNHTFVNDRNFDGKIDEVRIWNVVRSESEIQANMSNELIGSEEGLAGYWNMNEGVVQDLTDSGNHGTPYGDVSWSTDVPFIFYTYTPNAGWFGTDSFTYTATDGELESNLATVTLTVNSNNGGIAFYPPESLTFAEDTSLVVDLNDYISNPENLPLTYLVGGNAHINVAIDAGVTTFTSEENWFGSETMTFTVYTEERILIAEDVLVIVESQNDVPTIAIPDLSFVEDGYITMDMSEFVGDVDGDNLSLSASATINVSVSIYDFEVTIVSPENWFGSEDVIFTVNDGVETVTDSVEVTVTSVNDAPIVASFDIETDEDAIFETILTGSDVENDELTYAIQTQPANGSVSVDVDMMSYTPNANWYGTDSFTYIANDGDLDSEIATVNITVNSIYDAPGWALPSDLTFAEDGYLTTDLNAYITNPDNHLLSYFASGNEHINVSFDEGFATFTSESDWYGSETITFLICDETRPLVAGDVLVVVEQQNDEPTVVIPDISFAEDGYISLDVSGFIGDIDGDDLVLSANETTNVLVSINGYIVTIISDENWFGSETVTFTVSDGVGSRAIATDDVLVTITSVNDVPVANAGDDVAVNEDTEITLNGSGTDVEGDELTYLWTAPDGIILSGETVQSPTFIAPPVDETTELIFSLVVNDGVVDSEIDEVIITILNNLGPPPTPLNVRIVVTTDEVGRVVRTLTWDLAVGVAFYNVYACDTPDGEFIQINSEPIVGTSFESVGHSAMKFYHVTANNGGVVTVSPPKSNFRN